MFLLNFFLLECSNDFKCYMQIWACAVKLFENVQNLLAFGHSMVNQKFKSQNLTNWSIPLTDWSIPLTTFSTSTSTSKFKLKKKKKKKKQFCLMVCWRSWQHDTDFRGYEVGLWFPFSEIKSNQHKFLTKQAPKANENF